MTNHKQKVAIYNIGVKLMKRGKYGDNVMLIIGNLLVSFDLYYPINLVTTFS